MIRSFLPVGQGAFYCECFRKDMTDEKLNIVYDCGSTTNVAYVEKEIKHTFEKGEIIDALFISHLDEDHVNGIPFLLHYCNVKKIFFPIISSSNKKILKIAFDIRRIRGFISEFVEDPDQAIRNLNLDYSPKLIPIIEIEHEDHNNADYRVSGENVFDSIVENKKNIECFDWLYIPFNFRQEERIRQLKGALALEFGRTILEDELALLWENDTNHDRDKIKAAYKIVSGSLNTNSMTLFSGEINYGLAQYERRNCFKCGFTCRCTCDYKPSGCLYTGDYDASGEQKWKQLKKAYNKYWDHIGCVQVPHHGSGYSFNVELLELNSFYIISAGFVNKYRHPHASVMKAFLLNHIFPNVVTEQIGSAFYTVVL